MQFLYDPNQDNSVFPGLFSQNDWELYQNIKSSQKWESDPSHPILVKFYDY